MSELAGFAADADWLPASVRRAQAAEDRAEARQARADEAEREARREAAHDRALALYRSQAENRGEVVPALSLARGGEGLGRTHAEILADAAAMADHEDARQAARAHREAGLDREHVMVGRSDGWPESGREADRLIRRAADLHSDLVMMQARLASRQGRGEAHVAAVRDARPDPHIARGLHTEIRAGRGEHVITRVVTDHGNVAWP